MVAGRYSELAAETVSTIYRGTPPSTVLNEGDTE